MKNRIQSQERKEMLYGSRKQELRSHWPEAVGKEKAVKLGANLERKNLRIRPSVSTTLRRFQLVEPQKKKEKPLASWQPKICIACPASPSSSSPRAQGRRAG
eukprot:1159442-Pelagomonas_calceolata.AAC.5